MLLHIESADTYARVPRILTESVNIAMRHLKQYDFAALKNQISESKKNLLTALGRIEKIENHTNRIAAHSEDEYVLQESEKALPRLLYNVSLVCSYVQRSLQQAYAIVDGENWEDTDPLPYSLDMQKPDTRIASMTGDGRLVCRFGIIPKASTSLYLNTNQDMSNQYHRDLKSSIGSMDAKQMLPLVLNPIRIQYVHVFPTDYRQMWMTDNDNYAYKHYTDMIVNLLGRTDSALNCSFAYDTLVSDMIPSGTYCVVSQKTQGIMDVKDFVCAVQESQLPDYQNPSNQTG